MKKRVISLILIIELIIGLILPIQESYIFAKEENNTVNYVINIYLNNKKIEYNDDLGYPFIDKNNKTLVPFRLTLEKFGAIVTWDSFNKVAVAQKNGIVVKVPIGKNYIYRNGELIFNDTEAIIINNRTYLPIRVVMEAFGCIVSWSEETKSVYIDYKNETLPINKIPNNFDLRNFDKVTSVKDQGSIGACWAFAGLGAIESCLLPNQAFDFSEDHVSLTHGYNIPQTDGGDFKIAMSYYARWSGPVLEEDDPYGDGKANLEAKPVKHIQEAMLLPDKDYLAIKIAVLTYGGVQSALYMDENLSIENNNVFNTEFNAYYYNGNNIRNHDVLIVGWDDNYPKENFLIEPSIDGAFIAKNSYGQGFGEDGYFYISYEDTHIGTNSIVFSRIEDVDNYDNIYQTDWLGWVGRLGYGSDTAYFANAYTTEKEEELVAVSFYATDVNTTYEVYVVEEFNSKEDFKNRKLVQRGAFEYSGYYTVDFDEPIKVNGKFAVIVKITTPNSSLPVAAEYYKEVPWLDEVIIDDGEGYMSLTGSIWDSTEELLNSNVCLKAFTNDLS